jgi:hypothetical protein
MSEQVCTVQASRPGRNVAGAAAAWLSLAATPAFAFMSAFTALAGPGSNGLLCAASHASQSGMTLMYLLMSAAHLPAWLGRLSR